MMLEFDPSRMRLSEPTTLLWSGVRGSRAVAYSRGIGYEGEASEPPANSLPQTTGTATSPVPSFVSIDSEWTDEKEKQFGLLAGRAALGEIDAQGQRQLRSLGEERRLANRRTG